MSSDRRFEVRRGRIILQTVPVMIRRLATGGVVAAAALGPPVHGVSAAPPRRHDVPRNVSWHGGPVQRHPRVYVILWGPKWSFDAAHEAARTVVIRTIRALPGSSYQIGRA